MNPAYEQAEQAVKLLAMRGLTAAFAESCTGGLLTKLITDISGASAVLPGGVCSYSNEVKNRVLGVGAGLLRRCGAVSEPVALCMARGVRRLMDADIGVGTTGIAGPASDNTEKPALSISPWPFRAGVMSAANTISKAPVPKSANRPPPKRFPI